MQGIRLHPVRMVHVHPKLEQNLCDLCGSSLYGQEESRVAVNVLKAEKGLYIVATVHLE
jgi:hypothetical protein